MFDFPTNPAYGTVVTLPDGTYRVWDTQKWLPAPSGAGGPLGGFLPLSGGEMDGPLIWTATGATTPRAAQDRSADVANVLDFGADPTGATDSSAAFNAAIASFPYNNATVYIPAGRYTLLNAVNMGASCVICGAGRNSTVLQIPATFNMSALGVFVMLSDPAHTGTPTIKDLWIRFAQPNFAGMTRANLIQYPPAVYKAAASATGRPNFENLMISSAWIGFYLDNCAAYLDNIYMSAFSYGFQWSATTPTLDCCRVSNIHFWGFDFISTSPLGQLFMDGTTNCAWFGRIDGLYLLNFFSESSIITVDCGPSPAGGYYFFQNIGLDGPGRMVLNSNINLNIDSISNSRGNTAVYTAPGITVNGGRNVIDNSYLASSNASIPMISVQGGSLQYIGGTACWVETDTPFMTCSSGTLEVHDVTFATHLATPRTTPIISQTGTGYVEVIGCRFANFPTSSVAMVGVTTSANAFIDANNWGTTPGPSSSIRLPNDYVTFSSGNRIICGDGSLATAAQLSLKGIGTTNGLESKLRFHGTFGTGTDYSQYLAASIRGGFNPSGSWNQGYLNIWVGSTSNGALSDAGLQLAGSFTVNGLAITGQLTTTAGANFTAGDVYMGGAAAAALHLNGPAGNGNRAILWQSAGVTRWQIGAPNTESGSNAGSDLQIANYNDAGAIISTPVTITRSTGQIMFGTNTARAGLTLNGPVTNKAITYTTAGVTRWQLLCNAVAEGGSNAGSNFEIDAFDDTGVSIGRTLTINRADGTATFFTYPGGIGSLSISQQGWAQSKITAAATAPGASVARLAFVQGTNAGTAKLVAYAGTSTTPVTIMDNIGAGF